jgi:hypothetical protein
MKVTIQVPSFPNKDTECSFQRMPGNLNYRGLHPVARNINCKL